jgi:hypothetical protein
MGTSGHFNVKDGFRPIMERERVNVRFDSGVVDMTLEFDRLFRSEVKEALHKSTLGPRGYR